AGRPDLVGGGNRKVIDERVVRRHRHAVWIAVRDVDVDAKHLAQEQGRSLTIVAAAVAAGDIQHSVGSEGDVAAVVVAARLSNEPLARGGPEEVELCRRVDLQRTWRGA